VPFLYIIPHLLNHPLNTKFNFLSASKSFSIQRITIFFATCNKFVKITINLSPQLSVTIIVSLTVSYDGNSTISFDAIECPTAVHCFYFIIDLLIFNLGLINHVARLDVYKLHLTGGISEFLICLVIFVQTSQIDQRQQSRKFISNDKVN